MTSQGHFSAPRQIGRFRILRILGQGAQGVVYLAYDTQLERQVAIKTLALSGRDSPGHADRLLDSARTVSSLSHPNIVQVYEVGMHEAQPYVVFEYIEGRNLADLLRDQGALAPERATIMMSQILAGIAQVHASGFLHGDIKPANILVGDDGIPRVTDFGISRLARTAAGENLCAGTLQYMAPECVSRGEADYRSDVYALGLVFHEMLTGKPVYGAANDYAQMYRILNEPVPVPSATDGRIDGRLDAIVLKACQHDPALRYPNAAAMKADLDRLRVPRDAAADGSSQGDAGTTVTFLLRRMSIKSEFPALSASFSRINDLLARGDETSMQAVADLVIRDFALTQKVLKIVNSAEFALGKVTRVSQAITLLGISRLRSIAVGMMLADGQRRGGGGGAIAAALTDVFVAGVITRNIGRMIGLKSLEELFICGMFSRLGQLLTLYYLKEEHDAIQRHAADHGTDTATAAKAVLGIGYDELGIAIARRWNFPEVIVAAMRELPAGRVDPAREASGRIWHCAAYARELCALARIENPAAREAAFQAHATRFAAAIPVDPMQVRALLAHSMEAATKYVAAAELAMTQTTLMDGLRELAAAAAGDAPVAADAGSAPTVAAESRIEPTRTVAPARAGSHALPLTAGFFAHA